MFESIILPAISIGLSATSIPGPLQAYLLNVTLRYGWRRGLWVVLSPLITDAPIIIVIVFLLGQLPDIAIQGIRVIGGLLLLWIAWNAWKQVQAGANFSVGEDKAAESVHPLKILGTAAAMNAFSPGPYLFWATVNGPLLLKALEMSPLAALGMLVGFYGTFLGGMVILVLIFNQLGQIDAKLTRTILLLTVALLVWFGTGLIAEAFALSELHRYLSLIALVLAVVYFSYQRFKVQSAT